MDGLKNIFDLLVTFMVPTVVWALLAAGLYQLARERVRRVRLPVKRHRSLAQEGFSR